jgi:hypothetical protein
MVNSIRPLSADREPPGQTFQSGAARWATSVHTLKRAESHGLVATIRIGDRSIIPPSEVARIDREGLPKIPPGYKRKTRGFWPGGRKTKTKTADTAPAKTESKAAKADKAAKPTISRDPRRKREPERRAAAGD